MPNQPSADKAMLAFRVPRELKRQIEIEAAARKMTVTEFCLLCLGRETSQVELSAHDYEQIAKECRRARGNHS